MKTVRYEPWVQSLLVAANEDKKVSRYVLEEFIRLWDERAAMLDERDILEVKHAG